jgi:hypothetical protein
MMGVYPIVLAAVDAASGDGETAFYFQQFLINVALSTSIPGQVALFAAVPYLLCMDVTHGAAPPPSSQADSLPHLCLCTQDALLTALPLAVRFAREHRQDARVGQQWLAFMKCLAEDPACRVRPCAVHPPAHTHTVYLLDSW